MTDGFVRVATASPEIRVAGCRHNAGRIIDAAHFAANTQARLLVTPELGITGYTCGDLFGQQALLNDALDALHLVCAETAGLDLLLLAGLPLRHRGKTYNCAAVVHRGRVLGLVPKSHLPNNDGFDEPRQFSPSFAGLERCMSGFLRGVPIGAQLLFRCEENPAFTLGVEICEDLWVPIPPSVFHAVSGAAIIANLAASSETVGRAAWRRELVRGHSARMLCGYVLAEAGAGESTTDTVFAGHSLVAENGIILAEAPPFGAGTAASEIDVMHLLHERRRMNTYPDIGGDGYLTVGFSQVATAATLTRPVPSLPFVPQQAQALAAHCESVLAIQASGLQKRLSHTGVQKAVIGVSGGLDSSLALLVAARALSAMDRPALDILAVTMPGFGTTPRTHANAEKLCAALGASLESIDIQRTTRAHFEDIGQAEATHDVVYQNAQARMRTLVLMDLANQRGGLVVGTGDLSELALGWATFNGDHMSMYGVNASVPKTLVRHLIAHEATHRPELREVLADILDTPVSPELLPAEDGEISQQTEQIIGPYELHDFFLYHTLRWGDAPGKILRLAAYAFEGVHSRAEILSWMTVFYRRFFAQQYKRSCLPDGPRVGSVSLSPRGDWHMPSDAVADAWLQELEALEAGL